MAETRQVTPLKCPNPACNRTLGTTDGLALYLGVSKLVRTATIYCTRPTCAGRLVWHPADASPRQARHQQTTRW